MTVKQKKKPGRPAGLSPKKKQIEQPKIEVIPFEKRVINKLKETNQTVVSLPEEKKVNELPISEYSGKDFLATMQRVKL